MAQLRRRNLSLALNLAALVAGMVMLAYASVPLYRLFCQITGYGGTTAVGSHVPGRVLDRRITINFNADTDPNLPWEFKPGEHSIKVRIGEQTLTHYVAHNLTSRPVTGHATYNVVPHQAGQYFSKIECFCFSEQTLAANELKNMPVSFYIDPAIADDPNTRDIKTITLSYTFFSVKTETK